MRTLLYLCIESLCTRSNIIRLPCLQCKCDFALFKCDAAERICIYEFRQRNLFAVFQRHKWPLITQRASETHLYSFLPDERMRAGIVNQKPSCTRASRNHTLCFHFPATGALRSNFSAAGRKSTVQLFSHSNEYSTGLFSLRPRPGALVVRENTQGAD
jgi:hypothetical protein